MVPCPRFDLQLMWINLCPCSEAMNPILEILLTALSLGVTANSVSCLPDAIPAAERINITMDGVSMPLGIWQNAWDSSVIISQMYGIIASEVLGLHVEFATGPASELILGKLAGCAHQGFEIVGDCGPPRRFHVSFENWLTDSPWTQQWLTELEPYGAPINLGSIGYEGKNGMFVLNGSLHAGLQDSGLSLDFYRSYNLAFFDPSQYTAKVSEVDLALLKGCDSIELGYPGIADLYLKITGDDEGVLEAPSGKTLSCWQNKWWLAPACRSDMSKCVPVIMPFTGWGMPEMMQQAFWHGMPLAFASAIDVEFASLNRELQSLLYTWVPDTAFILDSPSPVIFPDHSREQYAEKVYKTMNSKVVLSKWASHGLQTAARYAFLVAERLGFSIEGINGLLRSHVLSGGDAWTTACTWLQQNPAAWRDWIASKTSCGVGFGLVDGSGLLVQNISQAVGCTHCPAGSKSTPMSDADGETFVCTPCPPGFSQENPFSTTCEPCRKGTVTNSYGSEACLPCSLGFYQNSTGQTLCISCGLRTTQLLGGVSYMDCVCNEGQIEEDGACLECPLGVNCPVGSTVALLSKAHETNALRIIEGFRSDPATPLQVHKCVSEKFCPGGPPGSCAGGRVGITCGACPNGEYWASKCEACTSATVVSWALGAAALAIGVVLSYYAITSSLSAKASVLMCTGASIAIMVSFFQNLGVVNSIRMDWPPFLSKLFEVASVFLNLEAPGTACLAGPDAWQYGLQISFVYFVALMLPAAWVLSNIFLKRCGLAWDPLKTISVMGTIFQLGFTTLAALSRVPFVCYRHPTGQYSVAQHSNVLCGESPHMEGFGISLMVVLMIFLSACFYAAARAPTWSKKLPAIRFLIFRFRPQVWWFGLVLLVRGGVLPLCGVVVPDMPRFSLTMMGSILLTYLGVQMWLQPWKAPILNLVDSLSTGIFVLLLFVCLGLQDDDGGVEKEALEILATLLSSSIAGLLLLMLCACVWSLFQRQVIGSHSDLVLNLGRCATNEKVLDKLIEISHCVSAAAEDQQHEWVRSLDNLTVYDLHAVEVVTEVLADAMSLQVSRRNFGSSSQQRVRTSRRRISDEAEVSEEAEEAEEAEDAPELGPSCARASCWV